MKNLTLILALLFLGTSSFGQSRDESSPTPVTGTTIRATLVDDAADSYQIYYYSMNLAAGRQRATIRSRTRECNGANVSVYVNGTANVSTASCDIRSNTSTGAHSFDVETAGNKVIAIYVTGGTNERFEIELEFVRTIEGAATLIEDEPAKAEITPIDESAKERVARATRTSSGIATPSGGSEVPGADPELTVCKYNDEFTLSRTRPNYSRIFTGIVFKPGTVAMEVTTSHVSGSSAPLSGSINLDQVRRLARTVLPSISGPLTTPLTDSVIGERRATGIGQARISLKLRQERALGSQTVTYNVILKGTGIVNCGPDASS